MAYAALVSLSQTITQILNHDHYSISVKEEQQIISLNKYVLFLQSFLQDFPDKLGNSLEGRMRDVANDAEDIIEYLMLERMVSSRSSSSSSSSFRNWKQEQKLKKVSKKIDAVAGEVMEMKDRSRKKDTQFGESSSANVSSTAAPMVGFEGDLMAIMSRLCGLDSPQLQAVPIFGMGGIGKTTLARNVFDHPLIMECFDIRAWVTVSQDYCEEDILSALLDCFKELDTQRSQLSNEEKEKNVSNEEKVYKSLKYRKFLIVMDDMWSTKVWDDVRSLFPDDNNGSRIILTTRLSDVAAYPDPCSRFHEIHFMDACQSWNLLKNKLFKHEDCPSELKEIGKMIAGSCRGLPLAIVVIAGLLSTVSRTHASWSKIAENVSSIISANGKLEEILSLSYDHLPHHLKPCFLYMGFFPKDHQVRVSKLIKLWVAEGFLECSNESKSLEEVAEECLEGLIRRSLVLVTERKSDGRIKSCSLHDLMWDLCIRKGREDKFLLNVHMHVEKRRRAKSIPEQRRLSTAASGLTYFSSIHSSTIHTIMWFHHRSRVLLESLGNFRLLRVLDAEKSYVESLPHQLFELFHLRYLGITYHDIIPSAISRLQNLQTLFVNGTDPWCLPQEIWRMPKLRHLISGRLPDPEGISCALEKLQTLSSQSYHVCNEGILKMIPNLKKLEICFSDSQEATHLKNLVCLNHLETLKLLSFPSTADWAEDSFVFPRMLKKLSLTGLTLPWGKMRLVGSLPNLEVLKLRDFVCKASTWETNDDQFSELRFLLIENSNLEHWITESSHFPRLKLLVLRHCWSLTEIPDDIGEIATLERIEVKGNKKKTLVESANRILEAQRNCGNDSLQIVCAPIPST